MPSPSASSRPTRRTRSRPRSMRSRPASLAGCTPRASSPTSSAIASSRSCAPAAGEAARAAVLDRAVPRRRGRSTTPAPAPGSRRMAPMSRAKISDLKLSWTREQYDARLRQGRGLHRRRRRLSDQPHAEISLRLRGRSGRALRGAPAQAARRLWRADPHPRARRAVALARAVLPPRGQAHVDAADEGHGAARPHAARGCAPAGPGSPWTRSSAPKI